jgi:hypothetical protein
MGPWGYNDSEALRNWEIGTGQFCDDASYSVLRSRNRELAINLESMRHVERRCEIEKENAKAQSDRANRYAVRLEEMSKRLRELGVTDV